MTSRDLINEILALVDTPPKPEGDLLPEYFLLFEEGYLEGVSRCLKIIMKHTNENQKGVEGPPEPPYTDPCATCRIRDHWCCDPWETRDEHEGDTE